jgi:thiol-disulfide isomerase/thioredoxin
MAYDSQHYMIRHNNGFPRAKLARHVWCAALGAMLWAACVGVAAQELTPWTNGPTPPLELTDSRGTPHALTAYRNRVVLVNFWATWCAPCREEMPALQALQNKMGKEQVVVLAVNYGEALEKVQQVVQQMPVDFPMLLDRHMQAAKAWQVRVLPTSFVLGQDGQIRYSVVGLLDWSAPEVLKLLTELSTRP